MRGGKRKNETRRKRKWEGVRRRMGGREREERWRRGGQGRKMERE